MDYLITYLDNEGNTVCEKVLNDSNEMEAEYYAFCNLPENAEEYTVVLV